MNASAAPVYLVDDDPAVLKALSRLLRSAGFGVVTYRSAAEFIAHHQPDSPGCLVLDLVMPEVGGLELQRWLALARDPLPVIFLTGRGDIPSSVEAMKAGAADFLTKPVKAQSLIDAVHEALRNERKSRTARAEIAHIQQRLATLTPREREVLAHVVSGQLNKQIAGDLGTVEKTIKVHRASAMEKMGAGSLAELVRMMEKVGKGGDVLPGDDRPHESPVVKSEPRTGSQNAP